MDSNASSSSSAPSSTSSAPSSSVPISRAAPVTPLPAIGQRIDDSHGTYADHSRFTSQSVVPITPVDSMPSTSSRDTTPDADQLISYLGLLSPTERGALDLGTVSLIDLTEASLVYPPLLENHNALFIEALTFAEFEKTFLAVPCYFCNYFNTSRTFENSYHVLEEHIGNPQPLLLAMLPEQAPDWWIRGDNKLEWSPLNAATFRSDTSSSERKRTELLARIEPVFEYLAGHGIINLNHIEVLIELAMASLPAIQSRQRLVEATSKQSNVCIRVLAVPQLEIALRFMEALKACVLNINYADSVFEEMREEEKYQLYLKPGEVSVYLKKYGRRPGDLVRWLYDSSAEVSSSSWKDAAESREHKIRQVMRKYLQGLFHLGRACQMKQRRLNYMNAMKNLRYLGQEDLQERLCSADNIEKIVIGQILQVIWDLQESSQQNCNVQDVINKKINQLNLQCLLSDARIISAAGYLDELQSKIGKASKLDYRMVVVPLMMCCIKKQLYCLFKQYVRNQSNSEGEPQKSSQVIYMIVDFLECSAMSV